MDVVPGNEKLVIEAGLTPTDIDVVHAGFCRASAARAFPADQTPTVEGVVSVGIGGTRLTDEGTARRTSPRGSNSQTPMTRALAGLCPAARPCGRSS